MRVHYAPGSHYSISAAMFGFQDEDQVTIEQDSLRNREDEEDDPETHQKGYRFKPQE